MGYSILMAKIIAAEKIKLGSVTVEKNANGKLVFDSQVQAGTDVTDSLQTRLSTQESDQDSVAGSIQTRVSTQESDQDSVAGSIQTRLSTQESDQDSVAGSLVTRLSTQESDQDSVATSLETRMSTALQTIDNNIRVSNYAIASGASSITCDFSGFEFSAAPKIVGMVKNGVATDPIMVVQLRSVSDVAAIFDFSDEISGQNYSLDVILTKEPHQ